MTNEKRTARIGFLLFWVVLAVACLSGYFLVRAAGMGRSAAAAVASPTPRPRATAAPSTVPLTVGSIFAARPPSLAAYKPGSLRTIIATGDVIPARSVNYIMVTRGDFLYPFRPTAAYLRKGDLTLINLESPLIAQGCPVVDEGMQFCGDPRVVQGLKFAGVDVACSANNHIGNYGSAGISETWTHLRAANIGVCGYGQVAYRTVRGLRFAFLAYNAVGERFDYQVARREIRAARTRADVVIVSIHWGREYVPVPETAPGIADDNPRQVARWIIDSGADLIIGNHPHHVQGVEFYKGHLITYAHGNFAFDQMFTTSDCPGSVNFLCSTREGVVGTYTFSGKRLVAVRYRPVIIVNYSQPHWATPQQSTTILNEMRAASVRIAHTPYRPTQ